MRASLISVALLVATPGAADDRAAIVAAQTWYRDMLVPPKTPPKVAPFAYTANFYSCPAWKSGVLATAAQLQQFSECLARVDKWLRWTPDYAAPVWSVVSDLGAVITGDRKLAPMLAKQLAAAGADPTIVGMEVTGKAGHLYTYIVVRADRTIAAVWDFQAVSLTDYEGKPIYPP